MSYQATVYKVMIASPGDVASERSIVREVLTEWLYRDRARQNVILELGYFTGKLGRNRICALHRGSVEIPTDYLGVVYVPLDEGGGWQLQLARELKAACFEIDMNKAV